MSTPEWRQQFAAAAVGLTIAQMEWDDVGDYWVMTLTDGAEMSVRLMAESSG
jgi:hypothetical protein